MVKFYDLYEEMNIENGLWALLDDDATEIKIYFAGSHGHLRLIPNPWDEDGSSLIKVMDSDGRPIGYLNSELNLKYLTDVIRRMLYQDETFTI